MLYFLKWLINLFKIKPQEIKILPPANLELPISFEKPTKIEQPKHELITISFLKRFAPKAKQDLLQSLYDHANLLFPQYGISSPKLIAHFLAQIYVESDYFTNLNENLNYAEQRLLEIFPNRFNASNVEEYAHNPQKIANRAYANKIGNGDEASGDGYKYRGRGFIQLTGKANYAEIGKMMQQDLVSHPELLCEPQFALEASLAYWQSRHINTTAEYGSVRDVTRKINAACVGLSERETAYRRAMSLLS